MTRTRLLSLAVALASLAVPVTASAWLKTGHRVGGAIAQDYLSPEARAGIDAVLGAETIAEASTWPDFMRASPETFWQEEASPYHSVTVPEGKTYSEVGAPEEGDAVTALERFARDLRDPDTSPEDKARALRFAVHIIGDLHQPLHAGNGLDTRGLDVEVSWFGKPTNLHMVWDDDLVRHRELSYTEMADWLGAKITKAQAREWMDADPEVWIMESAAIREGIYPEAGADLRDAYDFAHKATMERRLSQSGVRIAAWLNAVYARDN